GNECIHSQLAMVTLASFDGASVLYRHWPETPVKRPVPPVSSRLPSPDVPGSSAWRRNWSSNVSSGVNVATASASSSRPEGSVLEKRTNSTAALSRRSNGPPLLRLKTSLPLPPIAVTVCSPICTTCRVAVVVSMMSTEPPTAWHTTGGRRQIPATAI